MRPAFRQRLLAMTPRTRARPSPDLDDFGIEVPSWAYGNSGTRFKVFTTAGTPRDPLEKIADAAQVQRGDRAGAEGVDPHPVGQGRRLTARWRPTPRSWG